MAAGGRRGNDFMHDAFTMQLCAHVCSLSLLLHCDSEWSEAWHALQCGGSGVLEIPDLYYLQHEFKVQVDFMEQTQLFNN